ncbi:DUF2773 domain-containing protein, partial [Escherichia coli]|nr:DUF2773 domain-containing protein [Escherichia coli]
STSKTPSYTKSVSWQHHLRDLVKTGATRKIRSEARHRLEEKQ